MSVSVLLLAALAAVLPSCAEEAARDAADPTSCASASPGAFACQDDQLKICGVDGRWAYDTCDNVCADMGLVYGGSCGLDEDLGHDFCQCVSDCCPQGTQRCKDQDVEVCDACEWSVQSCSQYCGRYGQDSLGCAADTGTSVETCQCEGSGGALCGADFTKCGEGYMNICSTLGVWTAASCRDQCETQGFYYGYCEVSMEGPSEPCHCSADEESLTCRNTQPTCMGDQIAVCEEGTVALKNCATECNTLGLAYLACRTDSDRGHDACFCGSEAQTE